MTQVSTEVKDYAVVFHDKSNMLVTKRQAEAITDFSINSDKKAFKFQGKLISFSAIAKIVPIETFYEDYPDKKPHTSGRAYEWDEMKKLPGFGFNGLINRAPDAGLERMIVGIKRFIARNPDSPNAKALLQKMEDRLSGKSASTRRDYKPETWDQSKESWAEFSARKGILQHGNT